MALYEIISDDGCGYARATYRKRIDAAAALARKWAYEGLQANAGPGGKIAPGALSHWDKFARSPLAVCRGDYRHINYGRGGYVDLARLE